METFFRSRWRGKEEAEIDFHFFSNSMEYDRGDSFPFDFKPNETTFGSRLKGKLSPRSYSMQFERKLKSIFVHETGA